jgi:predicted Na+-dependent transporter
MSYAMHGTRWRIVIWGTAAFLLLLPLIAMQFTNEVNWDETDFVVFGAMLFGACGVYELAARMIPVQRTTDSHLRCRA